MIFKLLLLFFLSAFQKIEIRHENAVRLIENLLVTERIGVGSEIQNIFGSKLSFIIEIGFDPSIRSKITFEITARPCLFTLLINNGQP